MPLLLNLWSVNKITADKTNPETRYMKAKKKQQRPNSKLRKLRDLQTKQDAKGGNGSGIVVPPQGPNPSG